MLHTELHTDPDGLLHMEFIIPLRQISKAGAVPVGALVVHGAPEQSLLPLIRYWPVGSSSGETLLVRKGSDQILFLSTLRYHSGRLV